MVGTLPAAKRKKAHFNLMVNHNPDTLYVFLNVQLIFFFNLCLATIPLSTVATVTAVTAVTAITTVTTVTLVKPSVFLLVRYLIF